MFGTRLKEIRKGLGFTQESIVTAINNELDKISDKNISIGTYRNWEQNVAIPNSTYLTVLAPLLKTSTDFLLGIGGTGQASDNDSPTIERTVQTMRRLNNDGQGKVADYADDLDKSGQYKRATEPSTTSDKAIPYRTVTVHTDGAVAAGYGAPNDWGTQQEHTVITSAANLSYDYAADIDGDSMSPTYEDGGLAYIRRTTDYRDGHVYAIKVNGEDYIKRCYFYKDHIEMVSDNPDYDPIIPDPDVDTIKIIGEVIGYAPPENVDN